MNKKTKYFKPKNAYKIDCPQELLFLIVCYYPDAKLEPLWETNREFILNAWMELYPATRPPVWWVFDAAETTKTILKLTDTKRRKAFYGFDPETQKSALLRLGKLEKHEMDVEPERFVFSHFAKAMGVL